MIKFLAKLIDRYYFAPCANRIARALDVAPRPKVENVAARFAAFLEVASPDLLEDAAKALIAIANGEQYRATGEGQYLASVAAEMLSRAYERMTGAGK